MRQVLRVVAGAILLAGAAWLFALALAGGDVTEEPAPPPAGRGAS